MSMSIRTLAAASIAVFSLICGNAMAQEKIVIGTEGAYPPFNELKPDGTLVGFDIDIGKALCDEMKVTCTFVTNDWDGMIPALQAKKFDAIIASMSITPERKEKVAFSKKYYNTPPAVAVPKDSPIKSIADLKGKTIGAQASTTHANYVEKHFPDSTEKLYPTADEYKLDLSNGRLDAVVDDIVVLTQWVKSDAGSCCKIMTALPIDVAINGEGAGIAVRKDDQALADRFTKAIAAIRANGTYQKINAKYFDFDVYGGN
ncbi:ABC transporter substrate-binding protein [Allorhizobium sp. BGMRC 0089]|uniref:ABC transporter substrate-binding protein n=1 Tax=Allorhizobium sonneratiae TaxID=2934936 RepID=UPI002033A0CC|nr:ABC transporter substrate-binding protein [Allorhizobium sonneratiae]MCM2292919.1 ABC transporter substrate-binding protein [Allorhizobium sonneratiae]